MSGDSGKELDPIVLSGDEEEEVDEVTDGTHGIQQQRLHAKKSAKKKHSDPSGKERDPVVLSGDKEEEVDEVTDGTHGTQQQRLHAKKSAKKKHSKKKQTTAG